MQISLGARVRLLVMYYCQVIVIVSANMTCLFPDYTCVVPFIFIDQKAHIFQHPRMSLKNEQDIKRL